MSTARAADRSIELFPVGPHYHNGRPVRDSVVVGYAALPERALMNLLADAVSERVS